jgi:hypothetical protein
MHVYMPCCVAPFICMGYTAADSFTAYLFQELST